MRDAELDEWTVKQLFHARPKPRRPELGLLAAFYSVCGEIEEGGCVQLLVNKSSQELRLAIRGARMLRLPRMVRILQGASSGRARHARAFEAAQAAGELPTGLYDVPEFKRLDRDYASEHRERVRSRAAFVRAHADWFPVFAGKSGKRTAEEWLTDLKIAASKQRRRIKRDAHGFAIEHAPMIEGLFGALTRASSDTLFWAIMDLSELGHAASSAGRFLFEVLRHRVIAVRQAAIDALVDIGADPINLIASLVRTLRRDRSWLVRDSAARALGTVARANARAIDALITALSDRDQSVRWTAAISLKLLAPHTMAVRRRLKKILSRFDPEDATRDDLQLAVTLRAPC